VRQRISKALTVLDRNGILSAKTAPPIFSGEASELELVKSSPKRAFY
jgi:hypothetical protein